MNSLLNVSVFVSKNCDKNLSSNSSNDRKQNNKQLLLLAIRFCSNPDFLIWSNTTNQNEAKAFICKTCNITSRKQLDTLPEAANLFHQQIRRPFVNRFKSGLLAVVLNKGGSG